MEEANSVLKEAEIRKEVVVMEAGRKQAVLMEDGRYLVMEAGREQVRLG